METTWYKYFNYGTIVIVAILLVLILADLIPKDFYIPLLIFTIAIFILRIVARIYVTVQSKKQS
jgi:hypothetical protein